MYQNLYSEISQLIQTRFYPILSESHRCLLECEPAERFSQMFCFNYTPLATQCCHFALPPLPLHTTQFTLPCLLNSLSSDLSFLLRDINLSLHSFFNLASTNLTLKLNFSHLDFGTFKKIFGHIQLFLFNKVMPY